MQILKQNISVRMAKAFGTPQEQYTSRTVPRTPPTQGWPKIIESLDETTWGAWQAHDPETANRVEKIRALWNSTPTSLDDTESSAAATFLGPLGSLDTLQKIFAEEAEVPPAEWLCKAVALVHTMVEYKSLLCSIAYVEDPHADPAKIIKSLEHLLQHLNIDGCIRIMHRFVILNPTVLEDPKRSIFLEKMPPGVSRIVKAILVAGSEPYNQPTTQPTNQPSNQATTQPSNQPSNNYLMGGLVVGSALIVIIVLGLLMCKLRTPCPCTPLVS